MKKYYKDYKLVPKFLPNGKVKQEAVYTGKYYINRLNKTELTKLKLYCLTLTLCSIIVIIAVGLLNTSGSIIAYVSLPYVCLFLPSFYCLMGAMRFVTIGNKLEYAAYDKSINRLHNSAIGQIIIGSMVVVGDLSYIIFVKNMEKLLLEIVFLSGMLIVLLLSIMLLRILKKVSYEIEEPII